MANSDSRVTIHMVASLDGFIARKDGSSITDRWEVYSSTYHYGGDSPEPLGHFLKQYFAGDGKYYSRDNFLDAKPGTRRDYSNIAAALAGYIVERTFGEPLNVYTRKHIFMPLGMKDTGWFLSEMDLTATGATIQGFKRRCSRISPRRSASSSS